MKTQTTRPYRSPVAFISPVALYSHHSIYFNTHTSGTSTSFTQTQRPVPVLRRNTTRVYPSACTPDPVNSTSNKFLSNLLAGFEPDPELGAILSTYFVQGALGISRLAISFFLKDDLHLSPAETSALIGASVLPWLIKPVYGFLTDSVPIFGYRRRPYLVASAVLGAASWLSLATVVHTTTATFLATIGASVSMAVSDVVADSLVVARVRGLPESRSAALQSLCWGSAAVGGLLSAYFSGSLLESLGTRPIFALTAVLPVFTGFLAMLISESRVDIPLSAVGPAARNRAQQLWNALRDPAVYFPAVFIFLWQATPSPESALFYFQTETLQFGPEFLGRIQLASSAAALAGVWIFNTFLARIPLKQVMLGATLVSVPLGLTQVLLVTRANVALGLSDQLFALTDSAVLAVLGQVTFMPTLVLAARLCPPGVEGTLFAALMSLYNSSGTVSSELGALLTSALGIQGGNFDNLWLLVVICSISYALPLPLLGLMDQAPPETLEESVGLDEEAAQATTEIITTTGKKPGSRTFEKQD